MKKILVTLFALISINSINAQVNQTTTTYGQNFNTLDTLAATPSANLPTGWSIFESGTSAAVDQMYVGSTGSSNAGNTYSFGLANSTDRALGSVASGSNKEKYGVAFTNNTGSTITSLNINYTGKQWRVGTTSKLTADTLLFEYSTVATGIYDSVSAWIANYPLTFLSPITNTTAGAIDGTLPANQTNLSGTFNVTVAVGTTIYLRWTDVKTASSNDGLSIDDLNITFGTGVVSQPLVVSTIPADNATNIAAGTTNLSITFDKSMSIGTGNVYVKNLTAATTQTIMASACSASGNTVTIPGAILAIASNYAIQYDSTAFLHLTNKCAGDYDNTTWNFSTVNPYPLISYVTPSDNSTNVPITTQLRIKFNMPITAGSGNVTLKNLSASTQVTYAVPGAQVVISNDTAIITPTAALAFSTNYAVQFDSACFVNTIYKNKGIYTDTNWNFTTEAAPPPPVTSLNESFVGCAAPNIGLFHQFSNAGTATWKCTKYAHGTDSAAASMNGATATLTNDNTDWLISPAINVSAMTTPYLNFWSKIRFTGPTTKQVWISNNYMGGDPNTASWTNLNVNLTSIDSTWKAFYNTNLTANKSTPFNFAFKYISTAAATANAEEWTVDDVFIHDGPLNINNTTLQNTDMYVVNNVENNILQVMLDTKNADHFQLVVLDMMGKKILSQNVNTSIGKNKIEVNLPTIANGIYMVQLSNETGIATLKFVK